jgi:acyl-CoA dehydrogenase
MAFQLSEEHRAIRQAVREFGENEIKPVAKQHDKEGSYPIEIRQKAAKFDFVAPHIPLEYDGAGMNLL